MKPQHPASFTPDAHFMLGLSQPTLSLAGELPGAAGDMHSEIRRSTSLGLLPDSTGISKRVYALLGKGFEMPGQLLSKAGQRMPERKGDTLTLNVQAAINGVLVIC